MSTKLSALTAASAAMSFAYGIDATPASWKIPVNAAWGFPQLDANGALNPIANNTKTLGLSTAAGGPLLWQQALFSTTTVASVTPSGPTFDNGVAIQGSISYVAGVGPVFKDFQQINAALAFNTQGFTAKRTVVWPDAAGTVTVLGNTSATAGTSNSTEIATAAFVNAQQAPAWIAGRSYSGIAQSTTNATVTQNTLYAVPIWIPPGTTVTKLTAVVAVGQATTTVRLGIYADGGGKPTTLIVDGGTVATTAAGNSTVTISQTLSGGWYWLAAVWQGGATSPTFALANGGAGRIVGTTNAFNTTNPAAITQTAISGALPAPWGATLTESATGIFVLAGP